MSGLRRRWQIKPSLGTQINPGHPLSAGLVGCFLFNEAGGIPVELTTREPAAVNTATWTAGLSFNVQYVSWTSHYAKWQGAVFTKVVWFKSTLAGAGAFIAGAVGAPEFRIAAAGQMEILASNVASIATSNTIISQNVPCMGACSYSASGDYAFYLDGRADGSGTHLQTLVPATPYVFGAELINPSVVSFIGDIYEVLEYNRVLSFSEIQQLYVDRYCFMNPPGPRRSWIIPAAGFQAGWASQANQLIGGGFVS